MYPNGHGTAVEIIAANPQVSESALMDICRQLLLAIGENPEREGLQDTPRRFAGFWQEFIQYNSGNVDTAFETVSADQMVIVSGIRVWSLCEHHLLPFWCDIAIGYIATTKILGLSKFARIAHAVAHQLQLQERICEQIADQVCSLTDSDNVAVLAQGQHLCMQMRGIKSDGKMISSVMRGVFRQEPSARQEFLTLVQG